MAARSSKPTVWIEKRRAAGGVTTYRVRAEHNGVRLPDVPCGPRKEHAERVRDRLRADLWAGKLQLSQSSSQTLGQFAKQVLEHSRAHKAAATVANFEAPAIESLVAHLGAELPLAQLTTEDIEEWKMAQLGEGLAAHTVAMRIRSVKSLLSHAVRLKQIPVNPCAGVTAPKTESPGRVLLPSEIQRLLERLPVMVARAVWFDLNTGLRLAEVLALDWRWIQRAETPWPATVTGKGSKTRVVHLNAAARSVLGPPRESGRVFDGLSRHMIHSHLSAAARTLKLGRVRFHDLRHTWATEYMRRTGDLPGLMLEGGWSTLSAVKCYQHLSRSRSGAVETIDFGVAPPALPPNAGAGEG